MVLGWRGSGHVSAATGASWLMVGTQLGYSLAACVFSFLLCCAPPRFFSSLPPHASLSVLLEAPWRAASPSVPYSLKEQSQERRRQPLRVRLRLLLEHAVGRADDELPTRLWGLWGLANGLLSFLTVSIWVDKARLARSRSRFFRTRSAL